MNASIQGQVKSVRKVVPMIYAYSTPEIARHDGWIKIGYTEKDTGRRIGQQTRTVDVQYKVEWKGNAIFDDGSGDTFTDHDFHRYLTKKKGVGRDSKNEWFHINGPDSHEYFKEFRINRGVLLAINTAVPYALRAEQNRAVEQALDYSRLHEQGEFLWNAKPRFGKTLTAYDFCKRINARSVLIITNRPAIANSWYDDYVKFLGQESGYYFISHVDALNGSPYCMTREDFTAKITGEDVGTVKSIEFVSLQDLKGSIYFGGNYDKLSEVSARGMVWDVLIIDEAHEGVDTYKTDVALDQIKRKFTLHLSGTPFKALANEKFESKAIFNWTYGDEQEAKRNWSNPDIPNPYEHLPRLNLFTYQMSDVIADKVAQGIEINGETEEFAFDLNEFFETKDGRFVHNDEVDQFLNALTTQEKYPFSTEELRDKLKHTFWLLNRVDSAKALMRKLQKHPVFKNYCIVLAAGDGRIDDDDFETEITKSFDKVRKAIQENDKTITLSVGQLTTGVTIPEWTAVLMLSNVKSPALYMQAAFRSQNPCLFQDKNGAYYRKDNAYVFDFDPARTLIIFEEFANDLSPDTISGRGDSETRKRHVRELLNFFPVIGEDENGEMIELDAEKLLSLPRKIKSREVVHRGFMSDFLFQNISNVFRAPQEVLDILQSLPPEKEPTRDINLTPQTAIELDLDEEGEVRIPEENVIGIAAGYFGPKIFGDVSENIENMMSVIEEATKNHVPSAEDTMLEHLNKEFETRMIQPMTEMMKHRYGDDFRPGQQKKLETKFKATASNTFARKIDDYQIQKKQIEKQYADDIDACETDEEVAQVKKEYDKKCSQNIENLKESLSKTREKLVHSVGEDYVRSVETAKKERTKRGIEDGIRDHLRGFSRTIPSFLMAYGNEKTTLENFDTIVPDDVFKDVTSITLDNFRFLRDGGSYIDIKTGQKEYFEGHLFDVIVFNDSVKEFIRLRTELADYFDDSQKEDIFNYIPPQRTNQIFTPKWVVAKMVDMLEEENPGCFDDPEATFADLYMKSGLYVTEIVKRLYRSKKLKKQFPDNTARIRYILSKQVFGVAPTEIIYRIASQYILGFDENLPSNIKTNFVCADTAEMAKNGTLENFVQETFGKKLR